MHASRGLLAALCISGLCAAGFPSWAKDLPIGAIGTLSGAATDWGLATRRGVEIAIDELNAAGGLQVGGETYNPRLIIYDDQYTGQGGATAATRLVKADGVQFIIGPIGTPAVLGALGITTPAHVMVMSDGFSPKILTSASTYNFRISVTTKEFAPPMISWLKQHYPQATRVGIVGPDDAVGQQVVPILIDDYKAQGFAVPFVERYDRGTADFAPLLTRMVASGVDVLELDSSAPASAGLLLKQARQVGFKGVIIQIGGPSVAENMAVAGPLAEGFISFDFFNPDNAVAKNFSAEFTKKFGAVMSPWCPVMYNGARILFEAMRRAQSTDVDKVRAEMVKLDGYQTIFGPLHWGGEKTYGIDHQLMINFVMEQVKDGKIERLGVVSTQ